jgi:hypothetical protein
MAWPPRAGSRHGASWHLQHRRRYREALRWQITSSYLDVERTQDASGEDGLLQRWR